MPSTRPNTIEATVTLSDGSLILGNQFQVVWIMPFSSFSCSLDQFSKLVDQEIKRRTKQQMNTITIP